MSILTNVTGTASHNVSFTEALSSGLITPEALSAVIAAPGVAGATLQYSNGNGALGVDMLYAKAITLAATTLTIDLTSLPLIDGTTGNAAGRVRELIVFNPDSNVAHVIKVYATATNGPSWLPPTASALVCPGNNGSIRLSDPNSTGAGVGFYVDSTHKTFTLDSGANTVTCYLLMACNSVE